MISIINRFKEINKYWRNFSLYLFSSVLSSVVGVLISPFLAKNLSPEDFAVIGFYSSFISLVQPVLNFSFIAYYLRVFFKIKEEDRDKVTDTIVISLSIVGVLSLISLLILFYFFQKAIGSSFEYFPYAFLCFGQVFFSNFLLLYQVNCRMTRNAKAYAKVTISNALFASLLAVLFVVWFKWGAVGKFAATLIVSFIVAIYSIGNLSTKFQFDKRIFFEALKFGWPISLSAILNYLLTGIDRSMLLKLNDTLNYALYSIALSTVNYLSIFYTALYQTFEPDLYQAVAENNTKKVIKLVMMIVLLTTIIVVLFILFAKPILFILTYNRYTDAYIFARILSINAIITVLYIFSSNILIAYGYPKVELTNKAVSAIVIIVMYYFSIQYFGFIGSAWVYVFSFVPLIILNIGYVWFKLKKNTDNKRTLYG